MPVRCTLLLHVGEGVFGRFGSPRRINVERLRTLLSPGQDKGVEAIRKAITYYQSCYQGDTLQSSVETFQNYVRDSLGTLKAY